MRTTHTFAGMEVSTATYNEIRQKLEEAGYQHLFDGDAINMMGISLLPETVQRVAPAEAQLNAIVDAWEALPGGGQVKNSDVEKWMANVMAPAINNIRGFLRRVRPDGVLPPHPDDQRGKPIKI